MKWASWFIMFKIYSLLYFGFSPPFQHRPLISQVFPLEIKGQGCECPVWACSLFLFFQSWWALAMSVPCWQPSQCYWFVGYNLKKMSRVKKRLHLSKCREIQKALFKKSFNLFIHERQREREREREGKRQRPRQREKQAPCREPDVGLNPGSPGSGPGLQPPGVAHTSDLYVGNPPLPRMLFLSLYGWSILPLRSVLTSPFQLVL